MVVRISRSLHDRLQDAAYIYRRKHGAKITLGDLLEKAVDLSEWEVA
jgi:hypothetical protein